MKSPYILDGYNIEKSTNKEISIELDQIQHAVQGHINVQYHI